MAVSRRQKEDLVALKNADYWLYRLWRRTEINSEQMRIINRLQRDFIHPQIKQIREAARG